jgi:hypothetical protein
VSDCLIKVTVTKRPFSEEEIGFRLKAAHPNRAKYNRFKGEYVPSFAKPYLIAETSDHGDLSEEHLEAFKSDLTSLLGFKDFRLV